MYNPFLRITILIILLFLLAGCGQNSADKNNENMENSGNTIENRSILLDSEIDSVLVYFASENGEYLVPITLPIKPTKEAAKVAVEKVLAGPGDWLLANTVPEDTKLRDIYIRRNVAYIDLTNHFLDHASYEDVKMSVKSLVLTLTEFPEIETVQFLIDGIICEDIQGFSLENNFERPAVINRLQNIEVENDTEIVDIYYSDPNALYLIPVSVKIDNDSTLLDKATKIMNELIKGPPQNSDLIKTIWSGTKVRDISYNENSRTIVVDLSEEVIGYGGGAAAELLLVNSIVFSLTELAEVDSVQLLIEGEKVEHLPEGWDISEPITRPEHINYVNP